MVTLAFDSRFVEFLDFGFGDTPRYSNLENFYVEYTEQIEDVFFGPTNFELTRLASTEVVLTDSVYGAVITLSGSGISPTSSLGDLADAIESGLASGDFDRLDVQMPLGYYNEPLSSILSIDVSDTGYVITSGHEVLEIEGALPGSFEEIRSLMDLFGQVSNFGNMTEDERIGLIADLSNFGVTGLILKGWDYNEHEQATLLTIDVSTNEVSLFIEGYTFTMTGTFPTDFGAVLDVAYDFSQFFDPDYNGVPSLADVEGLAFTGMQMTGPDGTVLMTMTGEITDAESANVTMLTIDGVEVDSLVMADPDFGMYGGPTYQPLFAGEGGHVIGLAYEDSITGSHGDDYLYGGRGYDIMLGGNGNDVMHGGGHGDSMHGGHGHDSLSGDWASDTISGGDGNDQIDGGEDDDYLYGGAQYDTIRGGEGDDHVWGGNGRDLVFLGDHHDIFHDNTQGGVHGRDTVYGGGGDDTIQGGNGDDAFYGQLGADLIYGRLGNDQIFGGDHYDTIHSGEGNDTVWGGNGRDLIFLNQGDDVYNDNAQGGVNGQDTVFAGYGDDTIQGGNGDDVFHGQWGNDRIFARLGNDTVFGGDQFDYIDAGAGNDIVYGGNGRDTVLLGAGDDRYVDTDQTGELGQDTITGGDGEDEFVFGTVLSDDVITDFEAGVDLLVLNTGLFAGPLSTAEVVTQFASVTGDGVLFEFGSGQTILLQGLTSTSGLESDLHLI